MRALLEKQLGVLDQIVDAGLRIVLALQPTGPEDANVGLSYHRVTRAVRLTQAMQRQVLSDILALDRPSAPEDAAPAPNPAASRRNRVRGVVERVILAEKGGGRDFERLAKIAERLLEDEDFCEDFLDLPMSELIDRLCHDLNLSPDWLRLAEETWAKREVQTGPVGAPLKDPQAFAAAAKAAKTPRMVVSWLGFPKPEPKPEYAPP
jgi:hypothetical protein